MEAGGNGSGAGHRPLRIGIILVAYNAEATIHRTLDRIPESFWDRCAGVWISDDGSADATHQIARDWHARNPTHPITIVRQPENLGYGGNQKAGYQWAIDSGLDAVILLHGDGQYAPELVEELIAPIERGEADVVLGSRMLTPGGARAGGMPLYKYVGNRILTTVQNRLTNADLSEWHSGYRAYSVPALKETRFRSNSDGFDFDTEILLQMLSHDRRIVELPIPTYYGDEISYVSGMRYAFDVVVDVVRWRFHRSGFGSGNLAQVGTDYVMRGEGSTHDQIVRRLGDLPPSRILDLGCGPGWTAELLGEAGHRVTGVDQRASEGVKERMETFVLGDLEQGIPLEVGVGFDVVVIADALEHLSDPERLLAEVPKVMKPGGFLLVSVPNVAHLYPRLRAMFGVFGYDQRGILDKTHLRFFTRRGLRSLLRGSGFGIRAEWALGAPVEALGVADGVRRSTAARAAVGLQRAGVKLWPTLFAYQYLVELVLPVHYEALPETSTLGE